MIQFPTIKKRLDDFFFYMANCYNQRRFPELSAVYQFVLREGSNIYYYYISIGGGKADVKEGEHSSPSIKISVPVSTWFDLLNKTPKGFLGLFTGKCRIDGSLYRFFQMKSVFSKRFDKSIIPDLAQGEVDFENPRRRIWKKPDHVLILNASPRRENGFTYFYLKHLMKGIQNAGTKAEVVNIYDPDIKIEPCSGCLSCSFQTPGRCVIKDDANALIEKINNGYLFICSFPLYVGAAPEKLKALLNRLNSLSSPYCELSHGLTRHPKRGRRELYMAIFVISGYSEMRQFLPCIDTFKLGAILCNIPLIAAIIRPAAAVLYYDTTGERYLKDVLKALEDGGKQLIEKGKILNSTLRKISRNHRTRKDWQRWINMFYYLEQQRLTKANLSPDGSGNPK